MSIQAGRLNEEAPIVNDIERLRQCLDSKLSLDFKLNEMQANLNAKETTY